MGLDFSGLPDHHGAAIYFLHDGSEQSRAEFERLSTDVSARTKKQIIVMSSDEHPGSDIIQFYSLQGSKFVLIVRDDDQLHHIWSDGEHFDPSVIAYTAEQVG